MAETEPETNVPAPVLDEEHINIRSLLFVFSLVNKSILFCWEDLCPAVLGRVRMGLCPPCPHTSSGRQVTWLINVNKENLFCFTLDRFDRVWISKVKMSFLVSDLRQGSWCHVSKGCNRAERRSLKMLHIQKTLPLSPFLCTGSLDAHRLPWSS